MASLDKCGTFPKGGYTGAADPIGYKVYLFVFRKLTFDNRYLLALLTALAFGADAVDLLPCGARLRAAEAAVAMGVGRHRWTPTLLGIYHYFMTETLLLLLDGFALWATARCLRKGGSRAFLLVIFLWTAAV